MKKILLALLITASTTAMASTSNQMIAAGSTIDVKVKFGAECKHSIANGPIYILGDVTSTANNIATFGNNLTNVSISGVIQTNGKTCQSIDWTKLSFIENDKPVEIKLTNTQTKVSVKSIEPNSTLTVHLHDVVNLDVGGNSK